MCASATPSRHDWPGHLEPPQEALTQHLHELKHTRPAEVQARLRTLAEAQAEGGERQAAQHPPRPGLFSVPARSVACILR